MTNVRGVHGGRKARDGTVVSDKMEKTVVVSVQDSIMHPLYKKTIRRSKKYMAHDENSEARMGDVVRIVEAAPYSKRKVWRVVEVLKRAELPEVAPEAIDSTLVQELAATAAPPQPVAAPAAPAVADAEPIAEMEVVQADAGEEALEPMEQTEAVLPEADVPPMEEEEVVEASAAPEATEEGR